MSLQSQLDTFISLEAMFESQGEFVNLTNLPGEELQRLMDDGKQLPDELQFIIKVLSADLHNYFELKICLPSSSNGFSMSLCNSNQLSRKQHAEITEKLPNEKTIDSIMDAIELLREIPIHIADTVNTANSLDLPAELVRVWLYLVSLSTKSKRDDMVNWALEFNLTGFVLAGKPGILCLEGSQRNIDAYLYEIKTRSWADIPSYQKKISVVLVETICLRKFQSMEEITRNFEMNGHLNNRPDLKQVQKWFLENGFDEKIFLKIFIA